MTRHHCPGLELMVRFVWRYRFCHCNEKRWPSPSFVVWYLLSEGAAYRPPPAKSFVLALRQGDRDLHSVSPATKLSAMFLQQAQVSQ